AAGGPVATVGRQPKTPEAVEEVLRVEIARVGRLAAGVDLARGDGRDAVGERENRVHAELAVLVDVETESENRGAKAATEFAEGGEDADVGARQRAQHLFGRRGTAPAVAEGERIVGLAVFPVDDEGGLVGASADHGCDLVD